MIREATHQDIAQLVELGAQMHTESRFKVLQYDCDKVFLLFDHLINTNQFIHVIEKNGLLTGGLVGFITEHWASKDNVAYDCGLFISPEHRGGVDAARLIKRFRDWAIVRGAKMASLGISTGVHPERTDKLIQACGFEKIGYLYEGIG